MPRQLRFVIDFALSLVALPLATWLAVGISYVLMVTIFGPLIWIFIFYGCIAALVLWCCWRSRFGLPAAVLVCLAGWAIYAERDAIAARQEVDVIVAQNASGSSRPDADAVTYFQYAGAPLCDRICTELLLQGKIKTVFITNGSNDTKVHALTLAATTTCEGRSLEASKLLRDNNIFDRCIRHEVVPAAALRGLFIEESLQRETRFERTRTVHSFRVLERVQAQWQPLYERRFGHIDPLAHFPVFAGYFTGSGLSGVAWWRHKIAFGVRRERTEFIAEALGVQLTGTFDSMITERLGTSVLTRPKATTPAPPEELAAAIARMSQQESREAQIAAAQDVGRFLKENGNDALIRDSIERLLASSAREVKAYTYQALAYQAITFEARLLKTIFDGEPDWQASGLGPLLARFAPDDLLPYESVVAAAFFTTDRPDSRYALVAALPALHAETLNGIFERCRDLSDRAIVAIGRDLDHRLRRLEPEKVATLKAAIVPCLSARIAPLPANWVIDIARALARIGEHDRASAAIEQRLAAPLPRDNDTDRGNLKNQLRWIRSLAAKPG